MVFIFYDKFKKGQYSLKKTHWAHLACFPLTVTLCLVLVLVSLMSVEYLH